MQKRRKQWNKLPMSTIPWTNSKNFSEVKKIFCLLRALMYIKLCYLRFYCILFKKLKRVFLTCLKNWKKKLQLPICQKKILHLVYKFQETFAYSLNNWDSFVFFSCKTVTNSAIKLVRNFTSWWNDMGKKLILYRLLRQSIIRYVKRNLLNVATIDCKWINQKYLNNLGFPFIFQKDHLKWK